LSRRYGTFTGGLFVPRAPLSARLKPGSLWFVRLVVIRPFGEDGRAVQLGTAALPRRPRVFTRALAAFEAVLVFRIFGVRIEVWVVQGDVIDHVPVTRELQLADWALKGSHGYCNRAWIALVIAGNSVYRTRAVTAIGNAKTTS
jgi:hypothetical protein